MEEECGLTDLNCKLGEWASSAVGDAIENMANAVMEAFGKVIASLGTMWVNVGTPNLTATGAGSSAISPGSSAPKSGDLTLVLGYVTWISLAVAIVSLMALGAVLATRMRRGEGAAAVGKLGLILAAVVLISGASALVSGLMPSGPTNAGGAVLFLQSGLWWYMGAAAVLSVIIGGLRMVWEQRADPGRDTIKSLFTLVVVAGAGVTIIGILVAAADSFAVWLINSSLKCDVVDGQCFGESMLKLLVLGGPSGVGVGLGPLLVILLGLVAIFASFVQILLMVARGGMLVILAGILPLSASFTNTEMGKAWFRKAIAWLVAFILYKPAAAVVYAAAFQLAGTEVFSDDGSGLLAVLTGLMLMIIALFAMPALMRFVTPMVGAMAGGSAGGATAAALVAVPTGAAAGRLGSSTAGGAGAAAASGSSRSAPSGGGAGAAGKPGPSASDGGGGPAGATGTAGWAGATAASGTAGSTGAGAPGGAAGSTGAATSGSAAAGGGAAAGGAAGGSAAAGAAAGPAGMAAGAVLEAGRSAGQAAAGAARSAGEQSTNDGGGPDGSR